MPRGPWILAIGLLWLSLSPSSAGLAREFLWQTNAGGDDIHVIDVQTGEKIKSIVVGPEPHGLAATADGRTVFATIEASGQQAGELVWIDTATLKITRRAPICLEPHALAATPDGQWLYIPCRDGHYWVVDGRTGHVAKKINTGGRPHNTLISRDGRWAFLSPMGGANQGFVIDVDASHSIVKRIPFADSLRPSAISADGRYLLQQTDGLNGFQVADVERGSTTATVKHATPLGGFYLPFLTHLGRFGPGGFARCHGLGIRPDQTEVWSVCADRVTVHAFVAPEFPEIASIALPAKGYWITFSPDGRRAFVALSEANRVAVVDTQSKHVVTLIDAGRGPKRNLVIRRPE